MNILHINSYYSKSKFYKNLFDNQVSNGLNISVFVPVPYTFKNTNIKYGSYTKVSPNYSNLDRFFYFKKQNKIIKDLETYYNLKKYSLIHAHSLFTNGYVAMKMKEKYKIPYIVAVRNTDMNTFFKYMFYLKNIGIKILEEASQVIFLSSSYRDLLLNKYVPAKKKRHIFQKSKIIPNGIDDFWFQNKGLPKSIDKDDIKILFVGDINKNKNVLTVIKSIEELRKNNFNVKLTVIGKVINNNIYESIKENDFVYYQEPMPKEDLLIQYRSHDIFVMPSKYETFGLVYAEAMSQGTPVIYTRNQGFDGQFEEGKLGFNVSHNGIFEIAKSIVNVRNDYKRMSRECINKVDKYNWEKIVETYDFLYYKTIKNYK